VKAVWDSMDVGRKNIVFGIALFLALGVVVGIPLTVNLFGGSMLTDTQYPIWKVVHGYSVFLATLNGFFGLAIDRLDLSRRQKEVASWSILTAALFGGVGRSILVLFGVLDKVGLVASLGEVAFITLGTAIFLVGEVRLRSRRTPAPAAKARAAKR
jgi:uncharacterized membrane protein